MSINLKHKINKDKKEIITDDFKFYLVMDGYYRLDGGAMYGMVPKPIWEKIESHDERNRLYMAMNCLLAERGDSLYLVDTGIGGKLNDKGRDIFGIEREKTLLEELSDLGYTPDDITHVILTHLHFDHAGWIQDERGKLTFSNAQYYVQRSEWEEAMKPHVRFKDSYLLNYYGALVDSNQLVLLDGNSEIDKGVSVILTPGHSKGHQVVLFNSGEMVVAHLGDLVPIASMVRKNWTCGFDRSPEETITYKAPIMDQAYNEGWILISAHDRITPVGKLKTNKGKYYLESVF